MVSAWYMDSSSEDQRLSHHRDPPSYISLEDLKASTGVEYFEVNHSEPENDTTLTALKKDRGYTYEDEITCSEKCLPNYAEKLKNFFTEHLHTDEEIRLVLEGSGYFDVRDSADEWVRIKVEVGDLLIIPAGIYHRFTLDDNLPVNECTSINTTQVGIMFTLWYLILGAKEYRKLNLQGSAPQPAPPKQPVEPAVKPTPKPEPVKPTPPPSLPPLKTREPVKTPEPPKPTIEPPKQSPPRSPPSPQPKAPESPNVPSTPPPTKAPESPVLPKSPPTPTKTPSTPVLPSTPTPAKAPESPLITTPSNTPTPAVPSTPPPTKAPESPVLPKTPEPLRPSLRPETPKSIETPVKPPRSPDPFKPKAAGSPSPLSREDELFQKTLNFGYQRPEANGSSQPRDLSYGPKYQERQIISNPDSLESSEAED